jgi:hypothetical protein
MTMIYTGTAAERLAGRVEALTGTDPQFRAAKSRADIVAAIRRPELSLHDTVRTVMAGYAGRPAVAEWIGDVKCDRGHAGLGNGGRIARRPVDLCRAPADQLPGEHPAEPAVGTSNQGNRSGDLHGSPAG